MSTGAKRLAGLYPALSTKERALLTLQACREDRQVDPSVRLTVPLSQIHLYNRYMGILRAAGGDLAYYIAIVHAQIEQLNLQSVMLSVLVLWGFSVLDLAPHLTTSSSDAVQALIDAAPLRLLDDLASLRRDEDAPRAERLCAWLIDTLRQGITARSQELAAVEIDLGELSEELDGEDLLHPRIRSLLDAGKARLDELRASMEPFGTVVESPEPPDSLVDQLREVAEWKMHTILLRDRAV